ncbi:MAG TPA: hypothetical protein ENO11_03010 [Desulfobacteraceae bacterium]|nr:hypothetical protein [Desulfobacteraceae bacterium]HER62930.1 hypothetical protein [Desulfobacteraceae bacterium]
MSNIRSGQHDTRPGIFLSRVFRLGFILFLLSGLAVFPQEARALQVHDSPEGLYVHQMAHLFFAAALVFLLVLIHYRPIGKGKAWGYFKLSLFFFLLWNIDTFGVHWLTLRLPEGAIINGGSLMEHQLAGPLTLERLAYYFGRLDHLFCVPGMWFLVLSLRQFSVQSEKQEDSGENGS